MEQSTPISCVIHSSSGNVYLTIKQVSSIFFRQNIQFHTYKISQTDNCYSNQYMFKSTEPVQMIFSPVSTVADSSRIPDHNCIYFQWGAVVGATVTDLLFFYIYCRRLPIFPSQGSDFFLSSPPWRI